MPNWNWATKDKQGKLRTGYTENGPKTPDLLRAHLAAHFRNLDFTYFKCEEGGPKALLHRVPFDWYGFGTDRMKLEIDAGLRPYSEFLQPPIDINQRQPLASLVGTRTPWRRK